MTSTRLASRARPVAGLVLCLATGMASGCHVGNFSASIDSDSQLPRFEFSAIPSQWEPAVEETGSSGDTGGKQSAEE
ncbi:MAG TPA: hypothetical protein DIC23_08900 [Planctomycetaceae bacterium]|nr:hypothetical protein [Planctomycetaceae bacterium]|tara:strand:- start:614 stop:844 length:231 start_codon:yes stop_codon:yes gene_type:complete